MVQASTYQPLHHKYRPQRFDQLVGQEAIATTLTHALRQNRIAPAYLFSGPRGTGKTSSARILARSLNCQGAEGPTAEPCGVCSLCTTIAAGTALDVIEIDAASNTGVDNIRELIERSRFAPVQARWKVYVIDECHMLSTAAFNALLKTLEEPPPRVVFVLATTDPQRVLPTILSRCQRFDFRRIPLEALAAHLRWIAGQESIGISEEALQVVAQRAQGGLRDAESLLDQLSLLPAPIEAAAVWDLLGAVPEQELLELAAALAAAEPLGMIEATRRLLERGREPGAVLQGLAGLLRDLVLARVAPERPELTSLSPQFRSRLIDLAASLSPERLLSWQSRLRGSEQQLRQSVQPRLWLEVLLLGLLAEPAVAPSAAATVPRPAAAPRPQPAAANAPTAAAGPVNAPALASQVSGSSQGTGSGQATSAGGATDVSQATAVDRPPQPAASAPAPQASPQATPETGREPALGELWQQILASLELPSTRMLLSQQAHLVRLDGQRAVVQVAGPWLAMVQSRLPLLEKAVAQALGSPRQVVLEASSTAPPPAAQRPSATSSPSAPRPAAAPAAAPPAPPVAPRSHPDSTSRTPPPIPDVPPVTAAAAPRADALPQGGPQALPQRDPLEENARRLADFFNGEVVELDGPLEGEEEAA